MKKTTEEEMKGLEQPVWFKFNSLRNYPLYHIDNAYLRGDIIENDLSKEIENGRLFRLITKINIVLERQE